MPCYYPLLGYRSRTLSENGKRPVVFNPNDGCPDLPVQVPCGRCIGCRLERSRQWAVRCVHEASLHENNCFLTLTYDEAHFPDNGSLCVDHFQKFMKRLRKSADVPVRFLHCGEYGEQFARPHYHALIFGYAFPDRVLWSENNSIPLYRSAQLEKLWPLGHSLIGEVNFESAAYVCRYVLKKVTGPDSEDYYQGRQPEYITMSRRPGIGSGWFDKYQSDVYPSDEVVIRHGLKCRPSRYYDFLYDHIAPNEFQKIKKLRLQVAEAVKYKPDNSPGRLPVREQVKRSKLKECKRSYET